jgi:hypothetical protein
MEFVGGIGNEKQDTGPDEVPQRARFADDREIRRIANIPEHPESFGQLIIAGLHEKRTRRPGSQVQAAILGVGPKVFKNPESALSGNQFRITERIMHMRGNLQSHQCENRRKMFDQGSSQESFANLFPRPGDDDETGEVRSGHLAGGGQGISSLKQAKSNTSASDILK